MKENCLNLSADIFELFLNKLFHLLVKGGGGRGDNVVTMIERMLVVFPISLGRASNNRCTAFLDKKMVFPSASWYTSDSSTLFLEVINSHSF